MEKTMERIDDLEVQYLDLKGAYNSLMERYGLLLDELTSVKAMQDKIQGAITLHDSQLIILSKRFNKHIGNFEAHQEGTRLE